MTDARHVPCNLLTWPKLADLLPDQKLIYAYLWFNRFARSCGCYPFPVALAATELSLSAPSILEALREFVRRELVAMVESTGEIFVLDWFRFNTFPPGPRQRVLVADLQRIESPALKAIVEKSMSCLPREVKEREGKKNTMPSRPVDNFGAWRSSEEGTLAAGQRLGVSPLPGESMGNFRQRIQKTIECRR